ncbi:glycosyltransferase family 4 protein [Mycolicibacterium monacense]|uniref:glycosyltransferase family 4 protein n=1 Tax=Mycolicibacterium monacense TaxID=85693 RepID=UPI0009F51319|nr:hypothetical protein BST34_10275 [Mycolicibacterium monacense DSM 44395]QHP84778.1 glycosyltransferase [Mycolicibacterium monacense DSM 44395]
MRQRVVRIFHGGVVDRYQRRDEELAADCDVLLIVPDRYRELPTMTHGKPRQSGRLTVATCPTRGPLRNPLWSYDVRALAKLLGHFNPTIIDIHEEPYSLAMGSVLWAAPKTTPIIFRSSQNVEKRYPPPFKWIEARAYMRSSAAYVPSHQASDVLRSKGYNRAIHIVPNGVELPSADSVGYDVHSPRSIVFAGRYTERKGLHDLIKAASGLELDLHFAGGESELVRGSGWQDHGVLPYQALTELYRRCDAICVPSRVMPRWSEQFCRSLAEAMGYGLLPIVSTSGALSDVAGRDAITFSANSPSSLRASLEHFIEMPEPLLAEKRRKAAEHARQYSWSATSKQLLEIYEGVLKPVGANRLNS